jgi:hypothetical protein
MLAPGAGLSRETDRDGRHGGKALAAEQEGRSIDMMTGWDLLEVTLALLIGGRCVFEGVFYKQTARKSLRVLKAEYRYGKGPVRAVHILLGLLLMTLAVLLAVLVSTHRLFLI